METKTVQYPKEEVDAIKVEANAIVVRTNDFLIGEGDRIQIVIKSQEDAGKVAELAMELKKRQKVLEEKIRPGIKLAKSIHQWALDLLSDALAPYQARERLCDAAVLKWTQDQRRIAEKAAADAQRLAQEEANRKQEEQKKKMEDERLAMAQRLDDEGFKEEAEAVINAPEIKVDVAPEVPKPVAPVAKISGVHTQVKYYHEIVDPLLVCKEIAEGRQSFAILFERSKDNPGTWEVSDKGLKDMTNGLKEELRIPGVKVRKEEGLRKRTAQG